MLVRHGRPAAAGADDPDPGLTAQGRAQAEAVAARLARERVDALYSSTQRRALETVEPLVRLTGLPLTADEALCEFDRDVGGYVPLEEAGGDPQQRWQDLRRGLWNGRRFDLHAFRDRVVTALDAVVAAHAGERVVVACHGGVVNAYAGHVLGVAEPFFFQPAYTGTTVVRASRGGHREVAVLNDSCHLDALADVASPT